MGYGFDEEDFVVFVGKVREGVVWEIGGLCWDG